MVKLLVHITLESKYKPKRDVMLSRIQRAVCEIIQNKFPEYDIEIGDLIADWPDAEEEFPPTLYKDRILK